MSTPTITLTSSSTLMTDYLGGSPISHDGPLAVAADSSGDDLVFGVGSDHAVRCVRPAPATPTGWQAIDLAAGLPDGATPTHLAATRSKSGTVTLVVVCRGTDGSDHVFETSDFDPHTANRWTDRGAQDGTTIVAISVGYDTSERPLIVATGQHGTDVTNFVINPDPSDSTWNWKPVPCPFESTSVLATAVGHIPALESDATHEIAAVWSLHTMAGGETAMVITSVPDFQFFNHQIMLTGPTGFDVCAGLGGNPVLVAAVPSGSGSQLVALDQASQLQKDPSKVSPVPIGSTLPTAIDRVITTSDTNGKIDVWAHHADDTMTHASNIDGMWGDVLGFASRVASEATWTDPTTGRVDLFFVDLDDQLTWYRQDPTTTRWKPHPIRLSDLETCNEVQSYRTRVVFTDEHGSPVVSSTVTVSTTESSVLTINGHVYEVGPLAPAKVATDPTGTLTIVDHVVGLSAPAFTLAGDDFATTTIDPMADLKAKVDALTPDQIENAQMATDSYAATEPMLPSANPNDVADAHQAIQSLVSHAASLPSSGAGTPAKGLRSASAAPSVWALSSHPDGVAFSTGAAATVLASGVGDTIVHAFGDLWHAVKHGFVEVEHIVVQAVDDGIQLLVHAAGKVFDVLVKFVEQVWDVIETVFKVIGAAFADLVRWLGFIFRWTDILHTHTVIAAATKHGLTAISEQIANGKAAVADAAQWLKDEVVGKDLENKIAKLDSTNLAGVAAGSSTTAVDSPESQWSIHHFASHRTLESDNGGAPSGSGGGPTSISSIVESELGTMKDSIHEVGTAIFANPEQLTIGETVHEVVGIVEEGLIEGVENVALGLVDEASATVTEVQSMIADRWNIPVLTALYEKVIAPGSTLSLVDLGALVCAIPSTIAFKIATDSVPFTSDQAAAAQASTSLDGLIAALGAAPPSTAATAAFAMSPTPLAPMASMTATADDTGDDTGADDPTTPPPPPRPALDASYAFGYIGGVSSAVYGIFNGLMVAADEVRLAGVERVGYAVKTLSGALAAASGIITSSIALAFETEHDDLMRYDMFVTCYQVAFCVKDGIAWRVAARGEHAIIAEQTALDLVESALGVLNCVFFISLAIAEGVEGEMDTSNGLKTAQNIVTSLLQIAAFPADLAEDPVTKAIVAGFMTVFGVVPGILNCVRSDMDWKEGTLHLNT